MRLARAILRFAIATPSRRTAWCSEYSNKRDASAYSLQCTSIEILSIFIDDYRLSRNVDPLMYCTDRRVESVPIRRTNENKKNVRIEANVDAKYSCRSIGISLELSWLSSGIPSTQHRNRAWWCSRLS